MSAAGCYGHVYQYGVTNKVKVQGKIEKLNFEIEKRPGA